MSEKPRKKNIRTLQPKLPLSQSRKSLYAALATAKKAACMDEELYREVLAKHGAKEDDKGKISATTMSDEQIGAALNQLNGNELKPGKWQENFERREFGEGLLGDKKRMLLMIWSDLYKYGALEKVTTYNHAIHGALDGWVKHFFNESGIAVERVEFMSEEQLNKAIFALQQWRERIKDKKDPERKTIRRSIK